MTLSETRLTGYLVILGVLTTILWILSMGMEPTLPGLWPVTTTGEFTTAVSFSKTELIQLFRFKGVAPDATLMAYKISGPAV